MKSKTLGNRAEHFASFQDPSVIASYQYRPPFPPEVFTVLAGLITETPRRVLDIGCGTGFVARGLLPFVDTLDAVDVSAGMIEMGKRLPGGDDPRLRWIVGRAEEAPLDPPYALITAGDSIHWMDWPVLLPRLGTMLTANGYLAIFACGQEPPPWQADLLPIIQRYSTIRDYRPFDLVDALVRPGLFTVHGTHTTAPIPFTQSVEDYVASFHGRSSFSRERMPPGDIAAFDAAVRDLVTAYNPAAVTLSIVTTITWGKPHRPISGCQDMSP
jgi:SAM-dependent methyltransferase